MAATSGPPLVIWPPAISSTAKKPMPVTTSIIAGITDCATVALVWARFSLAMIAPNRPVW